STHPNLVPTRAQPQGAYHVHRSHARYTPPLKLGSLFARHPDRGRVFQVAAMRRSVAGFTLIELLIVVAIIALLAAIAFPAYNSYRVRADETACQAEMKQYVNFSMAILHNGS